MLKEKTPTFDFLAVLTFFVCVSSHSVGGNDLLWSEEFEVDGAPDERVWSYDLGDLGVNQELQIYTDEPENVVVENGSLTLTARGTSDGGFTSGRIRTQDKIMFQYATVEARISIPDLTDGLWPAFWTLGHDISSVGWPRCGEIDILEMGAGQAIADDVVNRRVYSTCHWDVDGQYASYGESLTVPESLDEGFHVWRMEWTPLAISTFVDDQHVWTIDISDPDAFSGHEFHAPHFLIINLAVGGTFTGIFNSNDVTASLPARYLVDYVRIFDNGHTLLSGSGLENDDCAVDLDGDGTVGGTDLAQLLARWGRADDDADLDENGIVDGADVTVLLAAWGQPCGS